MDSLDKSTMGDNESPQRTPTPHDRKQSHTSPTALQLKQEPPHIRQQSPQIGSSPTSASDHVQSPATPSKRAERIYPISSIINLPKPGPGYTEPLRSASSGRWSSSTPTPYDESTNPFDGDRLYDNFNEELDRQRQHREDRAARYAATQDTSGASSPGLLQHPMTMRFEHKETNEGHCVVTVYDTHIRLNVGIERLRINSL
jgi:hypothetical protein